MLLFVLHGDVSLGRCCFGLDYSVDIDDLLRFLLESGGVKFSLGNQPDTKIMIFVVEIGHITFEGIFLLN